jgi:thymidylate kinase
MQSDEEPASPGTAAVVKVVGPCKSGKSTLVAGLRAAGYAARSCGQEHSETPIMWQRIAPPDYLIFLDVRPETQRARVQRSDWSDELMRTQQRRLAHARQHSDLLIATDDASPEDVLQRVVAFLEQRGLRPAGR